MAEKFRFYALWLCLICIGIFILQTIIPQFTEIFILNEQSIPQFWRFLTSILLHGDLGHLIYNLFALALFGSMLEKFVGSRRFLVIFFVSGIFANLISVNFYEASLGASGAIYGILGALVVIKPLMMVWAFGFPMPMFIAGVLWTAGSVLGIFMPSNVGHIAHLSGIAVGFVLGLFLRRFIEKKQKNVVKIPDSYLRDWEDAYIE